MQKALGSVEWAEDLEREMRGSDVVRRWNRAARDLMDSMREESEMCRKLEQSSILTGLELLLS